MKKNAGIPPILTKMMIDKALAGAGAGGPPPGAGGPPPGMGAPPPPAMKKGGAVKGMKSGGTFKDRAASSKSSAHPDGIAQRGKTKGQQFRKGGKC